MAEDGRKDKPVVEVITARSLVLNLFLRPIAETENNKVILLISTREYFLSVFI